VDDFNFPRPDDDAEIEAFFENVVRTRDLSNLPPLTIEQKWNMVEMDERLRWKDEKAREEQAKKVPEQSRTGMIEERSPEWYLRKFVERSITPKDASGLLVSLRGQEVGCVLRHFPLSLRKLMNFVDRRQMVPTVHCHTRHARAHTISLVHQPPGRAEVCPVILSSL
jgi:hypothetical protein